MAAILLIRKLILLGTIESILAVLIYSFIPPNQESYMAAIQDKEALLASTTSPRLIFVGGSNLAFGLDSESIEDEFEIPVVNFGLHAALGVKTSLDMVEEHIMPGDIVVFSPEYAFFNNDPLIMYGSNDILADFLETNPAYIRYLAQAKWIELPVIALNVFERKVSREVIRVDPGVYVRSSFNSHGDVVGHLGKTGLDPDRIPNHGVLIRNPASSIPAFAMMEAFHQSVLAKGGTVLFEFPSLRMRNCDSTGVETFNALLLALNAHTTIPVLSAPYDRCYPNEYFYDTAYHLTAVGRDLRTKQLIESLSPILTR